jgi:hypothetical protein
LRRAAGDALRVIPNGVLVFSSVNKVIRDPRKTLVQFFLA